MRLSSLAGPVLPAAGFAPIPVLIPQNKTARQDVEESFAQHKCSDSPKQKSREDVNQAAFRIVREAIKDTQQKSLEAESGFPLCKLGYSFFSRFDFIHQFESFIKICRCDKRSAHLKIPSRSGARVGVCLHAEGKMVHNSAGTRSPMVRLTD